TSRRPRWRSSTTTRRYRRRASACVGRARLARPSSLLVGRSSAEAAAGIEVEGIADLDRAVPLWRWESRTGDPREHARLEEGRAGLGVDHLAARDGALAVGGLDLELDDDAPGERGIVSQRLLKAVADLGFHGLDAVADRHAIDRPAPLRLPRHVGTRRLCRLVTR